MGILVVESAHDDTHATHNKSHPETASRRASSARTFLVGGRLKAMLCSSLRLPVVGAPNMHSRNDRSGRVLVPLKSTTCAVARRLSDCELSSDDCDSDCLELARGNAACEGACIAALCGNSLLTTRPSLTSEELKFGVSELVDARPPPNDQGRT